MAISTKKFRGKHAAERIRSSQRRAAKKAEQAAKVLHSFAGSLIELEALEASTGKPAPTPRNWWKLQSGRFKNDPTFAGFVAQVQATRKQER